MGQAPSSTLPATSAMFARKPRLALNASDVDAWRSLVPALQDDLLFEVALSALLTSANHPDAIAPLLSSALARCNESQAATVRAACVVRAAIEAATPTCGTPRVQQAAAVWRATAEMLVHKLVPAIEGWPSVVDGVKVEKSFAGLNAVQQSIAIIAGTAAARVPDALPQAMEAAIQVGATGAQLSALRTLFTLLADAENSIGIDDVNAPSPPSSSVATTRRLVIGGSAIAAIVLLASKIGRR